MDKERRSSEKYTQDKLKRILNEQQIVTLQQMEATGWEILFIRSRLLLPSITCINTHRRWRHGDTGGGWQY